MKSFNRNLKNSHNLSSIINYNRCFRNPEKCQNESACKNVDHLFDVVMLEPGDMINLTPLDIYSFMLFKSTSTLEKPDYPFMVRTMFFYKSELRNAYMYVYLFLFFIKYYKNLNDYKMSKFPVL